MKKINVVVSRINGEDHHEVTNQGELIALLTVLDLAEDFIFEADGITYEDVDFDELFEKDIQLIRIVDYPKGGIGRALGRVLGAVFKPIMKLLGFGKVPETAVPDAVRQAKESPNNRLTQQTNVTRLFQARPESFGIVRAYPDLINQSLYQYVAGVKRVTEWFNVGIGHYDIWDIKYAESEISNAVGGNSIIYQPNEVIPEIIEPFEFPDVENFELRGANEVVDTGQTTGMITSGFNGKLAGSSTYFNIPNNDKNNFLLDLENGDIVNVTASTPPKSDWYGDTPRVTFRDNAYFMSAVVSGSYILIKLNSNLNDTRTNFDQLTLSIGVSKIAGPFITPIECTRIWCNFNARISGAGTATAKITYQEIDEANENVGDPMTADITLKGRSNISDTYFLTHRKVMPKFARYRVSVERTNDSSENNVLVLEEIYAINRRVNVVHHKDTILRIDLQATASAQTLTRRYNCMIQQRTVHWFNGQVWGYDPDAPNLYDADHLMRTRSFADAVLHSWLIRARMPLSMIDVEGLYRIDTLLPDARIGDFNYTFDDLDTSLGNRIEVICGVADVVAYWDGGILRFTRNEKKLIPSALFNPANTLLQNFRSSYDLNLPRGYDGIELKYINPTNNKFDFIYYKIVNGQISKGYSEKPMKMNLIGCRDQYQAEQRAIKEVRKLLYSRKTIQIRTFSEAETLPLGALVLYADILNSDYPTGYILSINGNQIEVNEKIKLTSGNISISSKSGEVLNGTFTKISDNVLQLSGIDMSKLLQFDGVNVQSPSRFMIYANNLTPDKYTLENKKPTGDGMWDLTLRQYDDRIYQ